MNIIVAGSSRGIGYEVVKALAGGEHKIIAVSRNAGKLEALAGECAAMHKGSRVFPFAFDLEGGDIRDVMLPFVTEHLGTVDVLIYMAGYLVNKPVGQIDARDFDRSFAINVKAAFFLVQALLPFFAPNAHILSVSSMGGYQGSAKFPGLSVYSASKGALAVLSECLAEELRESRVKSNCLALGAVQTEMLAEAFPGYTAPLSPQEMADFVTDFALNGHRYFNGKILPVSISTP